MGVLKPKDMKTSRHLWQGSMLIVCAAFFLLNVSISFKQLLNYSTYSSMRITDEDSIPVPAISICPHAPWSVPALVRAGINTSCLDFINCVFDVLYTLEGYMVPSKPFRWQDVELTAEEIVSEVKWAGETLKEVSWSRRGLTTMPCYTWNPNLSFQQTDIDVLEITFPSVSDIECPGMALKTCQETERDCNIDCGTRLSHYHQQFGDQTYIAILHAMDEEPIPGMLQPVIKIRKSQEVTVNLEYDDTVKENTPIQPCQSASEHYRCLRLCYIEELLAASRCSDVNETESISSQSTSSISCPNMAAWEDTWILEDDALEGRMEWWRECTQCGASCQQRVYYASQVERRSGETLLRIKMSTMLHERVVTSRAYTFSNFLADLGGGMGLWLGTCGFSLVMILLDCIVTSTKRWIRLGKIYCKRTNEDMADSPRNDKALAVIKVSEVSDSQYGTSAQKETSTHNGKISEVQADATKLKYSKSIRDTLSYPKQILINCFSSLYTKIFSGWQDWITRIIYVGFSIAFIVHSSGTASNYFSYPTVTQISLSRQKVMDPSVTLCSEVPFSLKNAVGLGFNNTDKACYQSRDRETGKVLVMVCHIDSTFNPLIKELEGFPDNLSIQEVWDQTSLPQNLLINKSSGTLNNWHPIHTDHNLCYKHINDHASSSENIISMEVTDQYENFNCSYLFPNTECRWVSYQGNLRDVHLQVKPWGEESSLVSHDLANRWEVVPNKKCYQYSNCLRELVVAYTVRRLVTTPKAPCMSTYGYNQRNCVEKCVLEELFQERGCAPPYLMPTRLKGLKECSVWDLRNGSLEVSRLEVASREERCQQLLCPRQCDRTFLSIRPFFADHGTQGEVKVRKDASPYTITEERLAWPMSRAVVEVGGALGLYLGLSILSVIHAVTSFLSRSFSWIMGALRRLGRRLRLPIERRRHSRWPHNSQQTPTREDYDPIASPKSQSQGVNRPMDALHSEIVTAIFHITNKEPQNHTTYPSTITTEQNRPTEYNEWSRIWCAGNIWTVASAIPCAIIFLAMAILQFREFFYAPVFSSYETHYLSDVVFPGVTFCVWPPFNPHRMRDLQIDYNYSRYCNKVYDYNNWKIKCDWKPVFEDLIQRLPGAWSLPLDQIWQEAAWRPSELFSSYSFAWKDYSVSDNDKDAPMKPSLTTLNRCFTFTPPYPVVRPQAVLSINLTKLRQEYRIQSRCSDAKYYWKLGDMYPANSIHNFWKCYMEQFKMSILVHPPDQNPILLDGLTFTQEKVPGGSKEACVQRCLAEATAKQYGCRLPFLMWSSLPLCSRDQYKKYPKYTSSVVESLNKSAVSSCMSSCPETCHVLYYTTTDNKKAASNIEVAFAKPMFHQVQESWAYSTVQLVSHVGSLASLFLGVSLYQLLTFCLTQEE